jgi:HEPN domain-containing protein
MSETDALLVETLRGWLLKADIDLASAAHLLTMGKDCPGENICFNAQQCIEKYCKALLIYHRIDFPKTHDLNALARLKPDLLLSLLDDGQRRRMTEYATVLRYPNERTPVLRAEARKAVAIARRIRRDIRRMLPKAALRRGKK